MERFRQELRQKENRGERRFCETVNPSRRRSLRRVENTSSTTGVEKLNQKVARVNLLKLEPSKSGLEYRPL